MSARIAFDSAGVAAFCRKWRVTELALFGSVLRDDFGDGSDVDVLVTFAPEASWDYFDWADMTEDLEAVFGRKVDLVEKDGLRNPFRRHSIMTTMEVVYEA